MQLCITSNQRISTEEQNYGNEPWVVMCVESRAGVCGYVLDVVCFMTMLRDKQLRGLTRLQSYNSRLGCLSEA